MEWSIAVRTALAAGMVLVSLYTDVRSGKIHNKFVLPLVPVGLVLWGVSDGWIGLLHCLAGIAVGGIALLIAGGPRWMAPGDAKLFTAIGALMGPDFVGSAMIYAGLAGGVLALAMMARKRLLKQWATSSAVAWSAHLPVSSFWAGRAGFMPYSIPIAIGCAIAVFCPLF